MKWILIRHLLVIGIVLSLAIVTMSQLGRAQTIKTDPSTTSTQAAQRDMEENWPNLSPNTMRRVNNTLNKMTNSVKLTKQGDKEASVSDWAGARSDYQQALTLFPTYSEARYGLGQCDAASGNLTSALELYRANIIYSHDARYGTVPGDGYRENNVGRLMEYVLLLSQAGQTHEALSVYRRAAGLLNYEDGKQNLDVLLPDFGPGGWSYTPKRLQAMAHIAIGYGKEGFNDDLALSHFQQAVALAPDSPLPYYYRGRHRVAFKGNPQDAKADYAKAAQLGDPQVRMAANKAMKAIR